MQKPKPQTEPVDAHSDQAQENFLSLADAYGAGGKKALAEEFDRLYPPDQFPDEAAPRG